jgi:hypothetical protein
MKSLAFKIGEYEVGYDADVFDEFKFKDAKIGIIISALLPYLFVIAGLILFGAIIASGFQLLMSAGNPESTKKAQGCLTHAVIGFVIIFVSYWLIQIIQIVFHIDILG